MKNPIQMDYDLFYVSMYLYSHKLYKIFVFLFNLQKKKKLCNIPSFFTTVTNKCNDNKIFEKNSGEI